MTAMEEKPEKHVKMSKQSQVIVERQRLTVFTYPNLSHFKPFFGHKKGFWVAFGCHLRTFLPDDTTAKITGLCLPGITG